MRFAQLDSDIASHTYYILSGIYKSEFNNFDVMERFIEGIAVAKAKEVLEQ